MVEVKEVKEVQVFYQPEGMVANEKRKELRAVIRNRGLIEVSYSPATPAVPIHTGCGCYEGKAGIPELYLLEDFAGVMEFLNVIKSCKEGL